jgi:putative redox protein
MSLTASAHSVPGTLRQAVVIDGRHHIVTDEPRSIGGDGSAAAPHELLPAALAACVSTNLVMYARTKEWPLETVDVVYDHRSTPRRFDVDIQVTGALDGTQLERLGKVASSCPVRRAVESGGEFVERITLRKPSREERGHMSGHKQFSIEEARQIGEAIGIDWGSSAFDVDQFRRGLDVELEHGLHDLGTNVTDDDPFVTGKIARAHLNEFPDYYTRLEQMEEQAKRELGVPA